MAPDRHALTRWPVRPADWVASSHLVGEVQGWWDESRALLMAAAWLTPGVLAAQGTSAASVTGVVKLGGVG